MGQTHIRLSILRMQRFYGSDEEKTLWLFTLGRQGFDVMCLSDALQPW